MHYFSILVVDDEKDFLETLVNRLTLRGIDTEGVTSGEEALKLIAEKPFDVIIMDISMPGGMDGIEALKEIKRVQPLTEVILLTGQASVETSVEGMKVGAFDYLLKPVKLEDLMDKIVAAIEKKDRSDEKLRSARIKKLLRYW
jgi:DNA-binding NtrC family response regulator